MTISPRALLAASLAICLPGAALAAPVCDRRADFVKTLQNRYAEQLSSIGVTSDGKVIELMVSEKGSWTIILTAPNGTSCAVSAGHSWARAPEAPKSFQFSIY